MKIEDIKDKYHVKNEADIKIFLTKRYGEKSTNEFWLTHENNKYPAISILVREDMASLHYFSEEGDPGLRSVGDLKLFSKDGSTIFYINGTEEELYVTNDSIVSFSQGLVAAKEFLFSKGLPSSVTWFPL